MRYPTNLFEALFLFALCGLLLFLFMKKHFKYGFIVYLPVYGIWRFLIEYVRDDDRGQIFKGVDWLTPSQFFAIIMVIGAIPLYFLLKYLFKNEEEQKKKNDETQEPVLKAE